MQTLLGLQVMEEGTSPPPPAPNPPQPLTFGKPMRFFPLIAGTMAVITACSGNSKKKAAADVPDKKEVPAEKQVFPPASPAPSPTPWATLQSSPSPGASPTVPPTDAAPAVPTPPEFVPGTQGRLPVLSEISALNNREQSRLLAAASAAAYCGPDVGCGAIEAYRSASVTLGNKFSLDGWQSYFLTARDGNKDVEGFVFYRADRDDVIIAFRGSEERLDQGALTDWLSVNARANPKLYRGARFEGNIHEGFLESMWGIWHSNPSGLIRILDDAGIRGKGFWVTGHSQGAATAALVAMRLTEDNIRVNGVHVFGLPRLAGYDFQGSYNRLLGDRTFVYANQRDPIPHLAPQFTSIGTNIQMWPPRLQALGKDGVDGWDFSTGASQGNFANHSLTDRQQGYFSGL